MNKPQSRVSGLWPLIIILLIAVTTRAITFRGFTAGDDADYARVAWDIAQGVFPPGEAGVPPHYPTRLGVAAPVGALFGLLGVHEWTLLIFPLAMSAASIALAYVFGRLFFSREAGLIAALLYAVLPIDCQFATWLLSDVPGAFWSGAGILALCLGGRSAGAARKILAGLVAAACFGVSWLTRTQVAHLAPFVLGTLVLWTWRDRRNAWMGAALAAGCMAVVVGEGLLYWKSRGDFLYTFHAAERLYDVHSQWYFREGGVYGWEPGHYAMGLIKRLFKSGPQALLLNPAFALLPLAALAASVHALYWRRRQFLFPAAWFLWAAAVFNFGSISLRHYEPMPWINAYMVPVLLPAVVVAAGWIAWMLSASTADADLGAERRFWAGVLCLAIALSALFGLYQNYRQGAGCRGSRRAAQYLSGMFDKEPDAVIYTDPITIRGLTFFLGYRHDDALRDYTHIRPGDMERQARILVNPEEINHLRDVVDYRPPDWVNDIPQNWRIETRWGDAVLYQAGP